MSLLFDGATRERRNRWAALAALYLAMFMNILDVSVVNLALPSIRRGLAPRTPSWNGCWLFMYWPLPPVCCLSAGLETWSAGGGSSAGVSPGLPPVPWHAVWRLI